MSLVHGLVEWVPLNTTIPVLAVYRVPVRQQEHFNKPSKMLNRHDPGPLIFQKFGHFKLHEFSAWTCRVGPLEHNDTSAGGTLSTLFQWFGHFNFMSLVHGVVGGSPWTQRAPSSDKDLQKSTQSPWPRTFDFFKNLDISNFMSLVHGLVEWVPVKTMIQYWQCGVFQWVNRSTLRNLQKSLNRHDPGPLTFSKIWTFQTSWV